ncbi:MAG: DUF3995 domain-containing protein [Gemmatimonadaceae bacterium]
MTALNAQNHRWIAGAAAAWSLIFAAFHFIWAAGWYIGLADPVQAAETFAKPAFLAYDLVAGAMCVVAVPVSLALGTPWMGIPRRLLVPLAWAGTALLGARAVASLVQGVIELATGTFSFQRMGMWEPWFYLGAVLFALNLWLYDRGTTNPPRVEGV